jgi:hypothetical protein
MLRTVKVLAAAVGATALLSVAALPASAATTSKTSATSQSSQVGYTKVTVAPSTLAALTSLGVAPGVVAPAVVSKTSPLNVRFPITGYALDKTRIKHSGGITLTAGSTTVTITDLYIDLARGRVSGLVAGIGRVDLFKIRPTDAPRYGAVKLVFTKTAAGALDAAFGTTALTEGFLFGYATPRPFSRI